MKPPNQDVGKLVFSEAPHLPLQTPGEGFLSLTTVPTKKYTWFQFIFHLVCNLSWSPAWLLLDLSLPVKPGSGHSAPWMCLFQTVAKSPYSLLRNNLGSSERNFQGIWMISANIILWKTTALCIPEVFKARLDRPGARCPGPWQGG